MVHCTSGESISTVVRQTLQHTYVRERFWNQSSQNTHIIRFTFMFICIPVRCPLKPLCHYAMRRDSRAACILNLAEDTDEWSASHTECFKTVEVTTGTCWIWSRVSHWLIWSTEVSCHYQEPKPNSLAVQPVATSLYQVSYGNITKLKWPCLRLKYLGGETGWQQHHVHVL